MLYCCSMLYYSSPVLACIQYVSIWRTTSREKTHRIQLLKLGVRSLGLSPGEPWSDKPSYIIIDLGSTS